MPRRKRRRAHPAPKPAPVTAPQPTDQRRHERLDSVRGGTLRIAVRPTYRGHPALLLNVSSGGLGFLIETPLAAGAVVAVEVCGRIPGEGVSRMARVCHCCPYFVPGSTTPEQTPTLLRFVRRLIGMPTPAPQPRFWLIGAEFSRPLEADELNEMLNLVTPAASLASRVTVTAQ